MRRCNLTAADRQWDFVKFPVNLDWGYVIFDWDNIFATYMTSLSSKEIAYSNFIQVIRSKTAMVRQPGTQSQRTSSHKAPRVVR